MTARIFCLSLTSLCACLLALRPACAQGPDNDATGTSESPRNASWRPIADQASGSDTSDARGFLGRNSIYFAAGRHELQGISSPGIGEFSEVDGPIVDAGAYLNISPNLDLKINALYAKYEASYTDYRGSYGGYTIGSEYESLNGSVNAIISIAPHEIINPVIIGGFDVSTIISDFDLGDDYAGVVNLGVGAEIMLGPKLSLLPSYYFIREVATGEALVFEYLDVKARMDISEQMGLIGSYSIAIPEVNERKQAYFTIGVIFDL